MQKKIMYVFFGEDCLPYKDQERTVHYPLLGSTFTGASDTTEIRFFVDRIGGIYQPTWIANTKLPNGKKGYKLLTSGRDSDFNENYVSLSLSQFYTQVKGDIYISLNGYNGGITLTQDDDDNYILGGTPTIQTTGSIKITMQYAVQILPSDIQEYISLDDILGYISGLASDDYVNQFFLHKAQLDRSSNDLYATIENFLTDTLPNSISGTNEGDGGVFMLVLTDEDNTTNTTTYFFNISYKGTHSANIDYLIYRPSGLRHGTYLAVNTSTTTLRNFIFNDVDDDRESAFLVDSTYIGANYYNQTQIDGFIASINDTLSTKANDSEVVHNTGNETISGTKTFNNGIKTNSVSSLADNQYLALYGGVRTQIFGANPAAFYTTGKKTIFMPDKTGSISETLATTVDVDKAGFKVALSIDSNYDLVVKLLDKNNNVISQDDVDLPLESIIVSATYYDTYTYQGTTYTNVIVMVLSTTSVPTIIPVGDLVSGLVNEQQLNVILEDYATLDGNNTFTGDNSFDNLSAETIEGSYVWFTNLGSDEGGTFAHYDDDYYDYDIRKLSSITFHGTIDDLAFAQGYNPDFPDSHNFTQIKLLNIATPVNATDGVNKAYVDTGLSAKQDALVSGTNIKTINNESILGSGNITISGGGGTWGTITGDIADQTDLQSEFNEIRQVAEGKCKSLVISYLDTYSAIVSYLTNNPTKKVYMKSSGEDITNAFISGTGGLDQAVSNPSFNTNDLSIPANIQGSPNLYFAAVKDENGDYYLYSLNNTIGADLNTGDLILVVETDVPDRWYDDTGYLYALETTKVDLTNYVDLTSTQTISGVKNFDNNSTGITFNKDTGKTDFKIKSYGNQADYNFTMAFSHNGFECGYFANNTKIFDIFKLGGRNLEISTSNFKVKEFNSTYGLLFPNTTSWTANKEIGLAEGTFNVINASDIASGNVLTADQIALLTNGKPTIIKGDITISYYAFHDVILSRGETYGSTIRGHYQGAYSDYSGYAEGTYNINANNIITLLSGDSERQVRLRNIDQINDKTLPSYPSNTGTFVNKMINGTWSWAQEWYGTQAEYDALGTYDSNTIYNILEN